jgi:hypothetical protein
LAGIEQSRPLVLVADHRRLHASDVAAVGDDHHVAALPDVVLPAVKQRPGIDLPARFLVDLPYDTVERVFAYLNLPAREFPFVPLVFQEQPERAVLYGFKGGLMPAVTAQQTWRQ